MSEQEFVTWKDRCGTCAYRPSTEASTNDVTLLKPQLCIESGELFLCHEDPSRRAICKGWADAFAVRLRTGKLTHDEARCKAAAELADVISEAEQAVLQSQAEYARLLYDEAVAKMGNYDI